MIGIPTPIRRGTARRLGIRRPRPWMPHLGRFHIIDLGTNPTLCARCGKSAFFPIECPEAPPCRCFTCVPP